LFRSSTGTTGPWQPIASSGRNATANTVTATGVNHFSVWTLGQQNNPLPVELTSFTAQAQGPDALLRWTTAAEKNSAYFALESSPDGVQFQHIGQVAAQGTTTSAHAYQWRDLHITRYQRPVLYYRLRYQRPVLYYRLRQVDQDSSVQYSSVQAVHLEAQAPQLLVYPTQVTDQTLRYSFTAPLGAEALLAVYNSTGQVVLREHGPQLAGGELRLPNLPMGWYVVQLLVNHKSYSARFYRP
ncbi:hypothetical protein BXP70_29120, partial [Hymenobacter crusticola]